MNLYLFSALKHVAVLGGLDYSKNLIRIAQSVVPEADVGCEEALRVPTEPRYDVVLADSVFQYFNDADYGQKVLERMWAKAGKMVVVTEVHDQEKKDEHMAYRRKCVENYDEVYAGWTKHFTPERCSCNLQRSTGADVRSYNLITNCTGITGLCLIAICIKNNA